MKEWIFSISTGDAIETMLNRIGWRGDLAYVDLGGAVYAFPANDDDVDVNVEATKLKKRRDALDRRASSLRARLNNASFVDRAPADVVDKTRQELADLETKLSHLEDCNGNDS